MILPSIVLEIHGRRCRSEGADLDLAGDHGGFPPQESQDGIGIGRVEHTVSHLRTASFDRREQISSLILGAKVSNGSQAANEL